MVSRVNAAQSNKVMTEKRNLAMKSSSVTSPSVSQIIVVEV